MYQSIHFQSKPRAVTNASKPEVIEKLKQIVGAENVLVEPEKVEPYGADAVKEKFPPEAVVFPESTAQMVEILKLANEYLFPVTARGVVTLVSTNLGLFRPVGEGFLMLEIAPGVSVDQVRAATGCPLLLAPDLKPVRTVPPAQQVV